jgi:hypothetical protein
MSEFPATRIAALSAVLSYSLVNYRPSVLCASNPGFISTFIQFVALFAGIWVFWRVILWPNLFSPLRHLPGPKGGSWWNGQFSEILKNPTGVPMEKWYGCVDRAFVYKFQN